MPDDIVTKLEFLLKEGAAIIKDQADEIERLRVEVDKWRKVADELYLSGNCSETCVDGAGGYDCSCSWGGAEWEYQQAVRGE